MNDQFTLYEDNDTDDWDPAATAGEVYIYFNVLDIEDTAQDTPFHKDPQIDWVKLRKKLKEKKRISLLSRWKIDLRIEGRNSTNRAHPPQAPPESINGNNLNTTLEGHMEINQASEDSTPQHLHIRSDFLNVP